MIRVCVNGNSPNACVSVDLEDGSTVEQAFTAAKVDLSALDNNPKDRDPQSGEQFFVNGRPVGLNERLEDGDTVTVYSAPKEA